MEALVRSAVCYNPPAYNTQVICWFVASIVVSRSHIDCNQFQPQHRVHLPLCPTISRSTALQIDPAGRKGVWRKLLPALLPHAQATLTCKTDQRGNLGHGLLPTNGVATSWFRSSEAMVKRSERERKAFGDRRTTVVYAIHTAVAVRKEKSTGGRLASSFAKHLER